ncbi:MAG TPA: hypothetical protein VJQ25_05890 [Nitrospira sp.]|nr:hypothetical protein [Nitrospira sp.]
MRLSRRNIICGLATLPLLPIGEAIARNPFSTKGIGVSTGPTALTSFNLSNTETTPTAGSKDGGMVFKFGDVPAGAALSFTRSGGTPDYQFDRYSTWPDGSLRFCRFALRDSDFGSLENRNYSVNRIPGPFNNNSNLTTPQLVAAIIAERNFSITLDTVVGSSSGGIPNQVALCNTQVAVQTRIIRVKSGPLVDELKIWGMFSNAGLEHAHLKVTWYIKRFKKADLSLWYYECAATVEQNWWQVPGKEKFTYNATLRDGGTILDTYSAVQHPYMMNWATVRLANDYQNGAPHTVGIPRPTLFYQIDLPYWMETGMIPRFHRTGVTYVMNPAYVATSTYVPGSSFSHRADVPGVGAYMGRGIIPVSDALALLVQSPTNDRVLRNQGMAGVHIPNHRKTNLTRTRIGEPPDIANTFPNNIFYDERGSGGTPSSYYTFPGLPTPGNYFTVSGGGLPTNGWVTPTGGATSGATAWAGTFDLAHAVCYSYTAALKEGQQYMIDDTIGQAVRTYQDKPGSGPFALAWSTWYDPATGPLYPGATGQQWGAIAVHETNPAATREMAWSIMMIACARGIIADNDEHAQLINRVNQVNAKYLALDFALIPPSIDGAWLPWKSTLSPWMDTWCAALMYVAYSRTRDSNWLPAAHHIAFEGIKWADDNMVGMSGIFHAMARHSQGNYYNAVTNPFYAGNILFDIRGGGNTCTISSSDSRIHVNKFYGGPWTVGDQACAVDSDGPTPVELTLGKIYTIININNNDIVGATNSSFQLRDPDTGLPVTFLSDYPNTFLGIRAQSMSNPSNVSPGFWSPDDRGPFTMATMALALEFGNPNMTQGKLDLYHNFFRAFINYSQWPVWNLDAA